MTPEENKRRAEDEHVKYIKNNLCDKDGDKPFVFISYKSDDWEPVLHDIVYRLVKEYGLHVYFDGSFDIHNKLWISQFPENMEHYLCKGILAFVDNKYATSYATVLELMYSQTVDVEKEVVQVNLDKLTSLPEKEGIRDTGLGAKIYGDNTTNVNFKAEKDLFNDTFMQLADLEKLTKDTKYAYRYKQGHKLTKKRCSRIAVDLLGYLKINENPYHGPNGDLTGIVASIRDACGGEVFDPDISAGSPEQVTVSSQNNGDRQEIRTEKDHTVKEPTVPSPDGEGTRTPTESGKTSLINFLKNYNNSTFKKDTYAKFRLVGTDGYERYGTEYAQSAFDLAWEFVMKLLAERGMSYIQEVTEKHPGMKNPVFISQDDYDKRGDDKKKYRQINVPGLEQYYMYRHYGQYQWIDSVLKPRLIEFGLPIDKFYFEYLSGNDSLPPDPQPAKVNDGGKPDKTDDPVKPGEITGPVNVKGKGEESVKTMTGSCTLEEFLAIHSNKTFQSKSCKSIKLIGVNGCEGYTADKNTKGKPFESARQLVFHFAMARIDEMGTTYIETVNNAYKDLKNPIFITQEEHQRRKERKESVTYTAVASKAGEGYSMCTHYSEYDWIKNSLVKQLRALGLELKDFRLEFE